MKFFRYSYCYCRCSLNYTRFATDMFGFLIIFPITRRIIFQKLLKKVNKDNKNRKDFIEGEYEDIDDGDSNDKKI